MIPRGTFYRWKKQRAWEREGSEPVTPVQAFEALPEEKEAVVQYALDHPEIRHRELSWRMIDEDVAYLSASTLYRILRAEALMHRQRGRTKRYRDEAEKASRPDEILSTMYYTTKPLPEKTTSKSANSTWATGDWNGDLEYDSDDLLLAFADGVMTWKRHRMCLSRRRSLLSPVRLWFCYNLADAQHLQAIRSQQGSHR